MMNNFRYPLVLFVSAWGFLLIGILFKIQHWPGATVISGSMLMVQFFAIVWLVVVILRGKGKSPE